MTDIAKVRSLCIIPVLYDVPLTCRWSIAKDNVSAFANHRDSLLSNERLDAKKCHEYHSETATGFSGHLLQKKNARLSRCAIGK